MLLFQEWMIYQFSNCHSIIGIFLQTLVQKVPRLRRHIHIRWNLDLILNYLNQLFLFGYGKWNVPDHHFIHHDSQRPNVNLFVVLFTTQYLWTYVKWCAAKCCSQLVILVHAPAKIAQFYYVLSFNQNLHHAIQYSMALCLCE